MKQADRTALDLYNQGLARHVNVPEEASLALAYELGRDAIEGGMSLLDLLWTHQASLNEVLGKTTREVAEVLARAAEFLAEALAPYEMAYQGFQDTNRELKASREEAHKANRAKSEFLSRMSHELRTPLNSILGFSQLLEMSDPTPEDKECLDAIIRGGKHLLELIDEVLDIARIESGNLDISLEPVNLEKSIGDAVSMTSPLADQRSISMISASAEASDIYVTADPRRLRQVLINLLSNAVKYNRDGGSVTVAVEISNDRARIDVTDTGPGIALEKQDRLWSAFDRLGAEQSGVEGTGLGLSLSKHLVEVMGGAMTVNSRIGEGATFIVELPIDHSGPLSTARVVEVTASSSKRSEARHLVLYIEDSPTNLRLVEMLTERREDIDLVTATDGVSGLHLAKDKRPALILLDLHLPDMTGDEVLARLRADPDTNTIPVVILSADAIPSEIDRLLAAGAENYLTKPLDVSAFYRLFDRLSEGQHLL